MYLRTLPLTVTTSSPRTRARRARASLHLYLPGLSSPPSRVGGAGRAKRARVRVREVSSIEDLLRLRAIQWSEVKAHDSVVRPVCDESRRCEV
eukprot:scaffold141262_cov130-Phaeocystis_antarctica.AAC.1